MTRRLLSRRRVLLAASCSIPLVGCSALVGEQRPQIYRLRPGTASTTPGLPQVRAQLVVDVPLAPQSLDTDRIALTTGETRLDYYANALWTDRAPVLLQGLLVEAFENSGQIRSVGRDVGALTPDYILEMELRDFESHYSHAGAGAPTVVMRAVAKLVTMPDRHLVGELLVSESAVAQGDSLDSVVEAFDAAVGRALGRIVTWTLQMITSGRRKGLA
jgi:cholesterol transport system auxiliary component